MSQPDRPTEAQPAAEAEPAPHVPRIYAASLSDYNAGVLHGAWLEVDGDSDDLQAGIDRMLASSPTTRETGETAEEWAIHDYDGWGAHLLLGEYEPLERLVTLARGLREHGEVFAAWASVVDEFGNPDDLGRFDEFHIGEYGSLEEFAEEQLTDLGFASDEIPGVPSYLQPYVTVDLAAWARDMQMSGDIVSRERQGGGIYVFWQP